MPGARSLALAAVATRLPILTVSSVRVTGATYTDPALVAEVARAIDLTGRVQ